MSIPRVCSVDMECGCYVISISVVPFFFGVRYDCFMYFLLFVVFVVGVACYGCVWLSYVYVYRVRGL